MPRRLLLAGLALGSLATACGGDDTATFQQVNCCVAEVYYICSNAQAAGRCKDTFTPDPSGCARQQGVACPSGS